MTDVLRQSDELVAELLAADHLVIATPVYNYNIPAALKAWIDLIVRKGMTLGFDGSGLLTGKTATVLLASGGVCTEGSPIRDRDRDIATLYLRLILNVIGITDVTFVAGGGAKVVDMAKQTMDGFVEGARARDQVGRGMTNVTATNNYAVPGGTTIGHVHLRVADLDRAVAFYGGVLGFHV